MQVHRNFDSSRFNLANAQQQSHILCQLDKVMSEAVGGGAISSAYNPHPSPQCHNISSSSSQSKVCRCAACMNTNSNSGAKVLTREEEFILKYGLLANNNGSSQPPSSSPNSATAVKENTYPLRVWLEENRDNPYPTKSEKLMLSIVTKMTLTQVSTWFANARRRLKKERRPEHEFSLHDFYPFPLYQPIIAPHSFYPSGPAAPHIPKLVPQLVNHALLAPPPQPQPQAFQPAIRVLPANQNQSSLISHSIIQEYLMSHREALNALRSKSSEDNRFIRSAGIETKPADGQERLLELILKRNNKPAEPQPRLSTISPNVTTAEARKTSEKEPVPPKKSNEMPRNIWSIVETLKKQDNS
ncbi:uncharacterized protein LOC134857156 isoform X2 [Symsagittifera roscoffensis]|uniref:uncharacterized protein LOC134857156 isoform X2 n=1 Tax=Symsagittifera roscoffensis TaxID=84072 RepID=UPI00307BAA4D